MLCPQVPMPKESRHSAPLLPGLVVGHVAHSPDFKASPSFSPALSRLTANVMETPSRPSAESARLTQEQVCESDYALRFGTLAARSSQLSALVDELLENLGQIRFDAPKLLERVKQANEAAKIASGL